MQVFISKHIFVGGSLAGAFNALHLAYPDKATEVPPLITDLEEPGGILGKHQPN